MSELLICFIKTIIGYLGLMFLSTNLIGFILKGFVTRSNLSSVDYQEPIIKKFRSRYSRTNNIVSIIFLLLTIGYLYLLFFYFNIGVTLVALLFMINRVPDLLFELRTGEKLSKANKSQGVIYSITGVVDWLLVILLWYSLC